MNFLIRFQCFLDIIFFLSMLSVFIVGMFNPTLIMQGYMNSRWTVAGICVIMSIIYDIFTRVVKRKIALRALEQADLIWKQGQRQKAIDLYVTLQLNMFFVNRSHPHLLEFVLDWLIEQGRQTPIEKIIRQAGRYKISLREETLNRISQLKFLPDDEKEFRRNFFKTMSLAGDKDRVDKAINFLKNPNARFRLIAALGVAMCDIRAIGVWYEMANRLGDKDIGVRKTAAKSFWQLKGVDFAIRSLRDEYENPRHLNRQHALEGINLLKAVGPSESDFESLLEENWQDCPLFDHLKVTEPIDKRINNTHVGDLRSDKEQEFEKLAKSSLSDENEDFAVQMVRLIRKANEEYSRDKDVYENTCAKIKEIGSCLCKNGGGDRMTQVAYRVQALGARVRDCEFHWDGICGWRY